MIRIDDYPSGIRPIQDGQIQMFDDMLALMPEVHLGIVPYLYKKFDCHIHETHDNIIPCCHGYNHRYDEFSDILRMNGDLTNKKTINIFNEFDGWMEDALIHSLSVGRVYLSEAFNYEVDTFIPVCNILNERYENIILKSGFKKILCDNEYASKNVTHSDYYGKLDNLKNDALNVITLHITWEWDTVQEKGFDYWANLIHKL